MTQKEVDEDLDGKLLAIPSNHLPTQAGLVPDILFAIGDSITDALSEERSF